MQSLPTLCLSDLAKLLHRSPVTVRRRWRVWSQKDGFPAPLPGLGLIWSRRAVLSWLDRAGSTPAGNDNACGNTLHQASLWLESRIGAP
jgi:hypothetical protein